MSTFVYCAPAHNTEGQIIFSFCRSPAQKFSVCLGVLENEFIASFCACVAFILALVFIQYANTYLNIWILYFLVFLVILLILSFLSHSSFFILLSPFTSFPFLFFFSSFFLYLIIFTVSSCLLSTGFWSKNATNTMQ
jgi:hypothetical protein